jgi:hypothetical protein
MASTRRAEAARAPAIRVRQGHRRSRQLTGDAPRWWGSEFRGSRMSGRLRPWSRIGPRRRGRWQDRCECKRWRRQQDGFGSSPLLAQTLFCPESLSSERPHDERNKNGTANVALRMSHCECRTANVAPRIRTQTALESPHFDLVMLNRHKVSFEGREGRIQSTVNIMNAARL